MLNSDQKKNLFESTGFKCEKCGFYSPIGTGLDINKDFNKVLCDVCNTFSPISQEAFEKYLAEKIEWQVIETFRNSGMNRASHSPHKQGMIKKSKQGMLMARPPFGYDVKKGALIPNEDAENVRLIFKQFAAGSSLNQISKTYGLSVNGVKKILKNFSYLGKVKFDGQIASGSHLSLVSPELFNSVQQKFESKPKKIEPSKAI